MNFAFHRAVEGRARCLQRSVPSDHGQSSGWLRAARPTIFGADACPRLHGRRDTDQEGQARRQHIDAALSRWQAGMKTLLGALCISRQTESMRGHDDAVISWLGRTTETIALLADVRLAIALGWFVFCSVNCPLLVRAASPTVVEAFQQHLSSVPKAFQIEFEEGDLSAEPTNKVEHLTQGTFEAYSRTNPRERFSATCQSGSFVIHKPAETLTLTNSKNQTSLLTIQFGQGYSGDLAWWIAGQDFVRLVKFTPESLEEPPATLKLIREFEKRAWRAYFFGLPPIDPATIRWDGLLFTAVTRDGAGITIRLHVDHKNNRVSRATFSPGFTGAASGERNEVIYEYEPRSAIYPLPSIFRVFIRVAPDPYVAARESVNIRLLGLAKLPAPFPPEHFLPAAELTNTARILLESNSVVFAQSRAGFVPITKEDLQRNERLRLAQRSPGVRYTIFATLLAIGVAVCAVLWRTNKNQKQTQ